MIPKLIHLCWLSGDPYPEKIKYCIDSWKKYLPDYEIMLWDTNRFDVNSTPWTKQAFEAKKYAFVSDYVRLWALEQYGGVYLDTDVMVLRSFEPLLNDTVFLGREESKAQLFGTCVMGCEAHCLWVRDMMSLYDGIPFIKPDGSYDLTTNVQRLGARMKQSESDVAKWGLRIYTHDYFSPITSTRVMRKTANTYAIHYYAGSWEDKKPIAQWREWTLTREVINLLVQIKRKVFD